MDNFAKQVINSGLSSRWGMRGCWNYEVRDLERHFGLELPSLYKDFLRRMGKGAGKFMQGTDFFYEHLYENRGAMEEVLESDGHPFHLSKETFVFSNHQGYIFFFFDTTQSLDDPQVYGYQEGDLKTRLEKESLSAFLLVLLDEQQKGWRKTQTSQF